MNTTTSPSAPASKPARNEDRPRVAETVSDSDDWNDSGSEPYLSTSARFLASAWVKLPVIRVCSPGGMAEVICGADTTSVSSTNADCLPMLDAVYWPQTSSP